MLGLRLKVGVCAQVFYNQQKQKLLGGCQNGLLVFQVAVKGPSTAQARP